MTRSFSDGHPKVLPACSFLSEYYFYNIFLQKSCRFSLQTLTKFEEAKTGSGVGFLRLTAVWAVVRRNIVKITSGDVMTRVPLRLSRRNLAFYYGKVASFTQGAFTSVLEYE